jgi:uncharacterized protein
MTDRWASSEPGREPIDQGENGMAKNTIVHFEFMSSNPQRSREFYSKIFNWNYKDMGMGGYQMIETGGAPDGGLMEKPAEAPAASLNVYFHVDSIEETLKKVEAAGGRVINQKTEIPQMGWWAMFLDADGICVGIYESGQAD